MKHAASLLALCTLITPALGGAAPLVPGPGQAGHDASLLAKVAGHDRIIHEVMTPSLGWGLEAFVGDAGNRQLIGDFVASGQASFQSFAGRHVYEVVDAYGEHGDLGMFGGVQAAGDAFRYVVLRDSNAPTAEVDAARATVLAAADGLHWYTRVTGKPGVFARGIRRITPESGQPPLPDAIPPTVPLFDAGGMPQPAKKEPTWRDDQSGELPFLIWLDDTSKDQFIGYVLALGAVYDAMAGDDSFPAATRDRLVADVRAIAGELMKTRTIGVRETDLVIMDADGRPVTFHDLSAEEVTPGLILDQPGNAFNAVMSLGALRTFFHVTGDEEIGRYYYEELLGRRGYLDFAETEASVIYMGNTTNFSNINMAFVAVYGLLRYESDPDVAAQIRRTLEGELYAPEVARQARGLKQSFFDFIYAGFRAGGTGGPGAQAVVDGMETLAEYPAAPHWNPDVQNCDDAEIASRDCTAPDGTKIVVSASPGRNGALVAEGPLPMRLRPPSNFEWRSDPHRINGGGGDRLNPAGCFWAAYWLGRLLEASSDAAPNVSPHARPRPSSVGAGGAGGGAGAPSGGAPGSGGAAGAGAAGGNGGAAGGSTASGEDAGCGCRTSVRAPAQGGAMLLALGAAALGRRRRRA